MSDPRTITPREAERWWIDTEANLDDLLHTVATEPERIAAAERAAVVKALIGLAQRERHDHVRAAWLIGKADAIKNGADW